MLGLNLQQNRLVSVPVDALSSLSHLQSLSLAYNSLKRLEMSGPFLSTEGSQLKSLTQLDLSFTKAERNNVCQILDLVPKLVRLKYLGNSANQLACIENNNIQELDLGFTDILTVLGKLFKVYSILLTRVLYYCSRKLEGYSAKI